MKIIEEGGEVEFGKYYSGDPRGRINFEHSEDVGETPKKADL